MESAQTLVFFIWLVICIALFPFVLILCFAEHDL